MHLGFVRGSSLATLVVAGGCFNPPPVSQDTDATTSAPTGSPTDGAPTTDDSATSNVDGTGGSSGDSSGSMCGLGLFECGGSCVDPLSDNDHCGGCDSPCGDAETCEEGFCFLICDDLTACGDVCVDTDTSTSHCGGCDNPCASGELCQLGECVADCEGGFTQCGDACVDVTTDDAHCGGCDMPCDPGEHCMAEVCEPACPMGEVECDGACVDPMVDPMHCGAGLDCAAQPGVACMGQETCNGGMCELVTCAGFAAASFNAATTFPDAVNDNTAVGIAWDGMSYWAVAGGSSNGITEGQYDAGGMVLGTYMAGVDFRSIFTQGDGTAQVYARGFNSSTILVQNAAGAFGNHVTLVGGALDPQAMVVWDALAGEFISFNNGELTRWDAMGNLLGTLMFAGYGTTMGEDQFPQNRGVAWAQGCYLTLNNGELSAWDTMGVRVDTATLVGTGADLANNLSLSHANGLVWSSDDVTWRGYSVF